MINSKNNPRNLLKILKALSEGHSIEQILVDDTNLTFSDVSEAAKLGYEAVKSKKSPLIAGQKWTKKENDDAFNSIMNGEDLNDIARRLKITPTAIASRLWYKLVELARSNSDDEELSAGLVPKRPPPPPTLPGEQKKTKPRNTGVNDWRLTKGGLKSRPAPRLTGEWRDDRSAPF